MKLYKRTTYHSEIFIKSMDLIKRIKKFPVQFATEYLTNRILSFVSNSEKKNHFILKTIGGLIKFSLYI